MGDSDDDYDRRRARDKFRRERSDYQERHGEERGRRDDYVDSRRDIWSRDRGRRDFRDADLRRRERYSPPRHDISPPMKQRRRNWDDHGYGGYDMGGYSGSSMMGSHQSWGNTGSDAGGSIHSQHNYGGPGGGGGSGPGAHRDMDMCPTQPPMMTFKQFLASQDDSIGDEEAVRKYNDYKLEFRRQQLNEFFLSHKEEEWFKSKYQPEECSRRKQEQMTALNRRIEVFFELLDKGWVEATSIDADKAEAIIRFLDAVVIKLEGGSDADLKVLDESPAEQEKAESKGSFQSLGTTSVSTNFSKDDRKSKTESKEGNVEKVKGEDSSGSDWDKVDPSERRNSAASSNCGEKNDVEMAVLDEEKKETIKSEPQEEEGEEKDEIKSEEELPVENTDTEKTEEVEKEDPVVAPRPLHKTCSIFLRNLAPSITKQEVEAMCRRFPGFLRVAIADPQSERRFFRRGWVTFERGVNIKETCWHLNNIRLRDCELGAIVNRDLTRRIRSCNGITSHKQVVRGDIKLVAKVIQTLDKRHELWTDEKENGESGQLGFGLISRNPLLKNITDYLIEEADAEEEELLGKSASEELKKEGEGIETTVERDESLIKVLDKLLLYLRIVHSLDYYNHSDYPNEDEMPNRCGIMHARGCPPSIKVTQSDINDYITSFENKMAPFLQPLTKLTDDESVKLGKKDSLAEVEKFVAANTQELGKDKWLCPLSGKKFKGPEFVRKHIFNKHGEKVEEVKKEVEFFNNYLLDPKRPQLPEHPGNRSARGEGGGRGEGFSHPSGGYQPPPPYGFGYGQGYRMPNSQGAYSSGYGSGRGSYGDGYRSGAGFYGPKRGGGGRNRGDPREIIGYHDLDAPEDLDVF